MKRAKSYNINTSILHLYIGYKNGFQSSWIQEKCKKHNRSVEKRTSALSDNAGMQMLFPFLGSFIDDIIEPHMQMFQLTTENPFDKHTLKRHKKRGFFYTRHYQGSGIIIGVIESPVSMGRQHIPAKSEICYI